ncbi:hypothetical protein GQ602_002240 [Ophiocordyceps camponoti-floridani]|uniref:Uncharacterized protein n=1 Tax=Ophiocordyceps camponoti-floridani TaxID=2030778 RepID=A0A8H4VF66_9HYPO|nr:hypothetical protein GQ602_002240 [Ophiocordyceps camponoti-floridani]
MSTAPTAYLSRTLSLDLSGIARLRCARRRQHDTPLIQRYYAFEPCQRRRRCVARCRLPFISAVPGH